jgi:hypothetical protein
MFHKFSFAKQEQRNEYIGGFGKTSHIKASPFTQYLSVLIEEKHKINTRNIK